MGSRLLLIFLLGTCALSQTQQIRPDRSELPPIGSDPRTWSPTTKDRPYVILGPGGIRQQRSADRFVGPGGILRPGGIQDLPPIGSDPSTWSPTTTERPVGPGGIRQQRSADASADRRRPLPPIGSDPRTWSPTNRPLIPVGPGGIRQQRSADRFVGPGGIRRFTTESPPENQPRADGPGGIHNLPPIGSDPSTWSPTTTERPVGSGGIRQQRSADASADRRRPLPPIGSDPRTWSPTNRPLVPVGPGGIRQQRSADASDDRRRPLPPIGSDPRTWSPTSRPLVPVGPGGIRQQRSADRFVGPGGIRPQPVGPGGSHNLPPIGSDPSTWSPTTTEKPHIIVGPGGIRQQRSADDNDDRRRPLPPIGSDPRTWSPTNRPLVPVGSGGIRQQRSADRFVGPGGIRPQPVGQGGSHNLPPIGSDPSTWSPTTTERPLIIVGPGGIRKQRFADDNADRRRPLPPIGSDPSTWSPTPRPLIIVGPGGTRQERSASPRRRYGPGGIRRDHQIVGPGGIQRPQN